MADANSMGMVPAARDHRGRALYDNPCPSCDKPRLSQKRLLGKPCADCVRKAATAAWVAKVRPAPLSSHPLHKLWWSMRGRCEQPSNSVYRYYGGRGIYVCAEWKNDARAFIAWAEENGYAPELEIDRVEQDGPYAPWNCQFIPHLANVRKSRRTKCTEEAARAVKAALANGQPIAAIAAAHGLSRGIVRHIKYGESWNDLSASSPTTSQRSSR